ncbi:hypothetical protein CU633_06675 [Bacillus sp. V3-13]|uniref:ABC transporter substrate-binding protein n=1 Tax=Bacillus sp. V3-13 TaxID=2053728 RepID=UPI000C786A37|nr:extracellular solute-binding protein [Bacillus sp. V3-13]PLR78197.1 hypothetical protein CU633_06675 [Bacillus sp. V3-13]
MSKQFAIISSLILAISLFLTACNGSTAKQEQASAPDSAGNGKPQTITFYTVSGKDEYFKDILIPMFEKEMKGKYKVEYGRGTPQEILNKIKAQGKNGNIDIVAAGMDAMPLGIQQGLWEQLYPAYEKELPQDNLTDIAKQYIEKYQGYGIVDSGTSGPVLAYNSKTVKNPPKSYAELKDWIKENPGKFMYAAVPNSGTGRAFFLGLASAMGEDPNSPEQLTKTWNYLEEISPHISSYPSSTSDTFTFLTDGTVDIIPHTPFWYARSMMEASLPSHIKTVELEDSKQFMDASFLVMLKDLPKERKEAALEFLKYSMKKEPQSQAMSVGQVPANKEAAEKLIDPKYKANFDAVSDALPKEYKEDGRFTGGDDVLMYPDIEPITKIYKLWEEKIQSKK